MSISPPGITARWKRATLARFGWRLLVGLALGMVLAPVMGTVTGEPEPGLIVYVRVAVLLSATLLVFAGCSAPARAVAKAHSRFPPHLSAAW